ncbi:septum formation initiator family protein [Candidatus Acetothermia bacterium]|nr:septum formation initiator family protein [Candidatus Acetothermia bacterium]MBI3643421.1 septum formation initiator family protein [Candidatus Acetothermia bacterium]
MSINQSLILRVIIGIGIASVAFAFYSRAHEAASYQSQIRKIEAQKIQVNHEIDNLKSLLARKDDKEYLKYLARRQLGLVMPGEEKYIIIEQRP